MFKCTPSSRTREVSTKYGCLGKKVNRWGQLLKLCRGSMTIYKTRHSTCHLLLPPTPYLCDLISFFLRAATSSPYALLWAGLAIHLLLPFELLLVSHWKSRHGLGLSEQQGCYLSVQCSELGASRVPGGSRLLWNVKFTSTNKCTYCLKFYLKKIWEQYWIKFCYKARESNNRKCIKSNYRTAHSSRS